MAGGMSNKISNVLGVPIPSPLGQQLKIRSKKNVGYNRNNDDIVYLANKTSWIRMISSVQVINEDQKYFNERFPTLQLSQPDDLAKRFVLFGGVSENNNNAYTLRSGISGQNAAYSPLGEPEINKYGYRPMPGITDASIETQGRLGSIRMATINFKVWDKYQLDIIDALYFKLGYTMFLEWGHTVYYDNDEKLQKSEYVQIDPFEKGIKKEKILRQIAQNVDKTNGNYDGMLGMCTNFNFSYNQEGGFDCTVKIIALGALADSTKLNQTKVLPSLNADVIKRLMGTLQKIEQEKIDALAAEEKKKRAALDAEEAKKPKFVNTTIQERFASKYPKYQSGLDIGVVTKYTNANKKAGTFVFADYDQRDPITGPSIYPLDIGLGINEDVQQNKDYYKSYTINAGVISDALKIISTNGDGKSFTSFGSEGQKGINYRFNDSAAVNDDVNILNFFQGKDGKKHPFSIDFEIPNGTVSQEAAKAANKRYGLPEDDFVKTGYYLYIMDKISQKWVNGGLIRNLTNWEELKINTYSKNRGQATPVIETQFKNGQKITYSPPLSDEGSCFSVTFTAGLAVDSREPEQEPYLNGASTGYRDIPTPGGDSPTKRKQTIITITFKFYDSAIISDLELTDLATKNAFVDYQKRIAAQNTPPPPPAEPEKKPTVATVTEEEAQKYHSGLEYFIRSIQLYGLNEFLEKKRLRVKEIDLYKGGGKNSFIVQAFANGVLSEIVDDLGKDTIPSKYQNIEEDQNRQSLMYAYASYGFNHNLMGTSNYDLGVPQVNFKDLFKAWAVPYKINGGIVSGTDVNYPVYIKLGLLIMIINHMCTIYDSEKGETVATKEQVPLLYIDFNTDTNICLSEPMQLSTDPLKFIIPWRSTNDEYFTLFDKGIIKKSTDGQAFVGEGTEDDPAEPMFLPEQNDFLSAQLPNFKDPSPDAGSAYRGRIMNALVNTDYILNLCKNFASNNESQAVYLKPFLQQLINDLNKSLGDINLFRIAYSDTGNCLYITDDQVCPPHPNEKTYLRAKIDQPGGDIYTLPLFGVDSIAKSISINTEISSRLANMIAISSNSNQTSDAGKDGSPFGHMNVNFIDRYNPQTLTAGASSGELENQYDKLKNQGKTENEIIEIMGKANAELVKAEQLKKADINKADKSSAKMFNAFIRSCFSTDSPSVDDIGSATNYYIERMNKRKSQHSGTRSSAMIPVSVEFKTDGIAGFAMGHSFALPEELLPNTYSNSFLRKNKTENKRIGFVVIGLTNSMQGNIWETTVKANMIYLKDPNDFVGTGFNTAKNLAEGDFIGTPEEDTTDTDYSKSSPASNFPDTPSTYPNIKFANIGYGNPASDKINPNVLKDVSDAAVKVGVTISITTAVSGHHNDPPSRHTYGQAVDIAIIDGISVRPNASNVAKIKQFTQALVDMGYAYNKENGNPKAVLTFDFPGHNNHVHVSNKA